MQTALKTVGQTGIYSSSDTSSLNYTKPLFESQKQALYGRPQLSRVSSDMLVKSRAQYDVGVWSSQGRDASEVMVKHLFNRYLR